MAHEYWCGLSKIVKIVITYLRGQRTDGHNRGRTGGDYPNSWRARLQFNTCTVVVQQYNPYTIWSRYFLRVQLQHCKPEANGVQLLESRESRRDGRKYVSCLFVRHSTREYVADKTISTIYTDII